MLAITLIGLTLALGAALYVMRRRAEEVDALRDVLDTRANVDAPGPTLAVPAPDAAANEVLNLLPIGLIHLDATGRIDRANSRAHALIALAPGRLIGRSVMEAFIDTRVEALLTGIEPGGAASGEIRSGAGEARMLVVRGHRTVAGDVLLILEDVTELRRLQQIRTEFIDNLSHELRTPLTTVSLLAETLARDAEGADVPQRMKDRIAKVEIETGHLVQMVSDLLDLARIEGGSQLRLEDHVDLGRLAESSVERLRLFAERQGVALVVDVEPGVPAIRGDEQRLGQVFVNLVHNAVKFSPDGGEVRVAVRVVGEQALVSVADHGIGIARGDTARVFERLYKVDRARVRGGGTGLGLSIARHVVEGHGGRIWVESEEGAGSTFMFTIPLAGSVPELVPHPDPEPVPHPPT